MGQVTTEAKLLLNKTEDAIQACNNLLDVQQSQACFSSIHQMISLSKDDIMNRLEEQYYLGLDTLYASEKTIDVFNAGNRQFLSENSQITKDELTKCIESI